VFCFQGPACDLCELIVQTVDTYLKNNKSEAAINATVYKLCNSLPASLKDLVRLCLETWTIRCSLFSFLKTDWFY
jgi:hypothetical protein